VLLEFAGNLAQVRHRTSPRCILASDWGAFLNWVLFGEQFNYVSGGFEQLGDNEEFKIHQPRNLPIDKSGYLYIYVSNETPNVSVFFEFAGNAY